MELVAGPGEEPHREGGIPSHLSPSGAGLFEQCPRRWKHRYLDRLPDPPGEAALAGTFAHRVLELLLQRPTTERTLAAAKDLARDVWPEIEEHRDFRALGLDDRAARGFRWRGWLAIEGLWTVEDPRDVRVRATEQDVTTELDGVPFRGIVDRLDEDDDGLTITDYKSGRAPSARYREGRLGQVLLYAAAVGQELGQLPRKARLLYLGQRVVDTEVTPDRVAEVTGRLSETWTGIHAAHEAGEFEARTGPLCAWCPYAQECPDGAAEIRRRHARGMLRADAPAAHLAAS